MIIFHLLIQYSLFPSLPPFLPKPLSFSPSAFPLPLPPFLSPLLPLLHSCLHSPVWVSCVRLKSRRPRVSAADTEERKLQCVLNYIYSTHRQTHTHTHTHTSLPCGVLDTLKALLVFVSLVMFPVRHHPALVQTQLLNLLDPRPDPTTKPGGGGGGGGVGVNTIEYIY